MGERAVIREGNSSEERAKPAPQKREECAWMWRTTATSMVQRHEEGGSGEQTVRLSRARINEDIIHFVKEVEVYTVGRYCSQLQDLQLA